MTKPSNNKIKFFSLHPQVMTIAHVIEANKTGHYNEAFKLTAARATRTVQEEIDANRLSCSFITENEIERLLYVAGSRPTDLVFTDKTFTHHISDALRFMKFAGSKRTNIYRGGAKFSIGEALEDALDDNPALADTTFKLEYRLLGSTLVQSRRVVGGIIHIDAPSTAFGLIDPDMASRRTYAAAAGNTRGAALA